MKFRRKRRFSRECRRSGAGGFDPLEFDRYTRFPELAEGVNDVATVQQALTKNPTMPTRP
jgi:chemosensory pili system protein ChpA (sensor histidine kinase/response regulator)